MIGSRFAPALRSALPATALVAAALALLTTPVETSAALAGGPAEPATCMPRCVNAIYPYLANARASAEEATASADHAIPGGGSSRPVSATASSTCAAVLSSLPVCPRH